MEITQALTVYTVELIAGTNLLILSGWFFNHSLKEFSNPLLFANIIFLIEFLPEPVRVGHSRYRVGNLRVKQYRHD